MSEEPTNENQNSDNQTLNEGENQNPSETEDLSTIFTPEEVTAKKEALASAKAEEDRRAKLTDDEKAAEDKAKADQEAANVVPEEYADFTVPKGMEVDNDLLSEVKPIFKELGLSQANAQKLIDVYSEKIGPAFVKKQAEQWEAQKEDWKAQVKADKEIGGANFDKSVSEAVRVLNTIGTPELKKVFDEYGLGNHPEFVRVFSRMATHLKEGTLEMGDKGAVRTNTLDAMADRLYGGEKK